MKVKNILVSQPKPVDCDKSPYGDLIRKFNVKIEFRKFFKIEGVAAKEFRQERINILDFTAIIFTSKHAVDHFFRICEEMRITVPDTMKYFCISESTALYLQKYVLYRKRKIFHGKEQFQQLLEVIKKHKTESYLLPCSDLLNNEMSDVFDENKINYTKALMFETVSADLSDIDITNFDMLVFFSPSGIKSLQANYPNFVQGETVIAAFGATTHTAIKEAGLTLNIEAPSPKAPSMIMALNQFLEKAAKGK
ncbi:MAG: uroporphyrinogen-III synthase [Bacteroidetes bacterium]|nr:uroporphyrinogen-III synthase [Bacteroidota bacterium]